MKKWFCLLILCLTNAGVHAQEGDWLKTFNIIWESRWQQTGIPMSAVRWSAPDKTIKYSINASATRSNADRAREAMDTVTQAIAWKAIEVPDGSADVQIEFNIRTYKDDELRQAICAMQPNWRNWLYTKIRINASEQYAYRCVLHELMHAFGFPGHPQGDTVLSYFEGNQSKLKDLDVFLLRAWYSDAIKVGESPFLTVQTLTRLWVKDHIAAGQQEAALQAQQRWYQSMFKSMQEFASGKGEPPAILYRSGRISEDGVRAGRANMQGMLGAAYLNGWTIDKDAPQAAQLLLMGAQGGNAGAASLVARHLVLGSWGKEQAKPLCQWLNATPPAASKVNPVEHKAALEASVCVQSLQP